LKFRAIAGLLIGCVLLVGCSSRPNLVGTWRDVGGTTRIFSSAGTCQNVALVDIGGTAPTFVLSDKPVANGRYSMYVEQGGYNGTTFFVEAVGSDQIQIYKSADASQPFNSLTRQ
jgi:hypothetical protein